MELLSLLPAALCRAVLAHFETVNANGVGTGVGANDDAVGIEDSDGAVSR